MHPIKLGQVTYVFDHAELIGTGFRTAQCTPKPTAMPSIGSRATSIKKIMCTQQSYCFTVHQDQPYTMSGCWVTSWSGCGLCCWCTLGSSVTCSNQLSMVKNIYMDTKINLLWCKWAELGVMDIRKLFKFYKACLVKRTGSLMKSLI